MVTFDCGEGDDIECSQGAARPEQGCRQGAQAGGAARAEAVRAGAGRLPRGDEHDGRTGQGVQSQSE
ncbi:hypothetical protein Slala05_13800 [Streptomyces lavendulae subsp. lavendulae]|nr:hypothetical protein Slala05_13800 [Streptomyces lavendulae subsp. lavendulae]